MLSLGLIERIFTGFSIDILAELGECRSLLKICPKMKLQD